MKTIYITILLVAFTIDAKAQNVKVFNMAVEMQKTIYLDGGGSTEFWGYSLIRDNGAYNASLPGPVLEINKGDSIYINMYNDSPEDHTIHLHGLDVGQLNDGVPATSFAVDPQETVTYAFKADHAGVFMYHCHVLTTLHLTMGMYGMIVVHNYPDSNAVFTGGPTFNGSYNFLTSDMDRTWNDNVLSISPMYRFKADYFMVNGKSGNQLYNSNTNQVTSYVGDTTVLRLANIAYSQIRYVFPPELNAKAYMSDGRVLPQEFDCDTLIVNAGERYTVVLVPDENINDDILVEYYEARNGDLEHTNHIKLNGDLSVKDGEISKFDVYPNPLTEQFTFATTSIGSVLEIYTLQGQLIKSLAINSYATQVNTLNFVPGIYIVKYQNQTLKLVKQ